MKEILIVKITIISKHSLKTLNVNLFCMKNIEIKYTKLCYYYYLFYVCVFGGGMRSLSNSQCKVVCKHISMKKLTLNLIYNAYFFIKEGMEVCFAKEH